MSTASSAAALSYLFVPGIRPERFAKALASGADRVIIDLEDAVAPGDKAAARNAIAQWLGGPDAAAPGLRERLLLRINDEATPWHSADLDLAAKTHILHIMLPKCESARQVGDLRRSLGDDVSVLPLIETARGMVALNDIAAAPGIDRLAFGSLDYMADLDLPADSPALAMAAAQIAIASRAAGIAAPVAGVTPALDATQVQADMAEARALGFGAKMCIHPSQVAAVLAALAPLPNEVAWAQRILQAWQDSSGGAIQLDGKMVDRPVVLKAERILARAARAA